MRSRRTRSGASASITEVSSLPAWISRRRSILQRADHRAQVQRAEIEAEVAAQFTPERLQNAAVAAVPVDDQKIARRQRAGEFAGEIAQERRHAADRQRQRPRRQSCSRDRPTDIDGSRQRSSFFPPALDDAPGERLGQHGVGVERQMRAVLLHRSHRQAQDGARAERVPTSWNVSSPIVRPAVGPAMAYPLIMRIRTPSLRMKW